MYIMQELEQTLMTNWGFIETFKRMYLAAEFTSEDQKENVILGFIESLLLLKEQEYKMYEEALHEYYKMKNSTLK